MDDHFLIQQTLNRNKNAFRFLVLRYQKPIFKFLSSFNLPEPVREEVAQETFLRAYKNLKSYDENKGASFSTWLFTIARNLAVNENNRHSHRFETSPGDNTPEATDAVTPESKLNQRQTQTLIEDALQKIPAEYRQAVVLSHMSEHSLEEIAAIENCSIGTVKSRIFRGKALLRKLISPRPEGL